ncbi:hypothetical protein F5J12DRAFT_338158 [Pisolithus orientalis]|uniref:uncharacterized protein n=1 Tax=Pisolithus orientalis TaxID=936130 RepID=UPI002223F7C1|nr:uncharacterized protein F5J12DRAFT_338158 [Pisolithus orientalis]KAI5997203.1 hypothetical protein F5J12DRAFT_338158 [Pisolithus orientalis]
MQSDVVIVRMPSFYTEGPDGEESLKQWMDSNYTKPCKAVGVLYMHNLAFSAGDSNLEVSKHLGAFRRTCRPNLIPSVIRVVPTWYHIAWLSNKRMETSMTQFRRQANDEGVQFCSTLPDGKPFDGTPETAWVTVQELLVSCDNGNVGVPRISLADSLHQKFQRWGLVEDIDEAISLAHAALGLCPPGHPDRALSQECLARCLKAKAAQDCSKGAGFGPSFFGSSDIQSLIKAHFFATVENLPPRLLYTPTGVMCNREAQLSYFELSHQYKQLLLSASLLDSERLQTEILSAVTDFFQIVMLSHRWGSGEPLLREIEGKKIYDLGGTDGLEKLQQFCVHALKRHFNWAWSDTCCINRRSSAESDEAFWSLFSWYRRSSLTIVYLSDVSDTDSLASSVWFEQGWTLQELLASPTVLFYRSDWSLYTKNDSTNHKTDPAVLEELQNVTGITKRHLVDFYPGMDDARTRLHWASGRRTTRPEDIAYSLFGIFEVRLSVLYGESVENALGRLLAEIISRSGDVSVLDWVGKPSSFNSCFPADLAPYRVIPQHRSTPNDSISRSPPVLAKARKLYSTLAALPRATFVSRRLVLPSIIHKVTEVSQPSFSTSSSRYTYVIHASRLRPVNITLSHRLSDEADAYILVRPCGPKSQETQTAGDDEAAWEQLEQLKQPFRALLLKKLPHNEYERIASDCEITACVQDLASTLHAEVLIPEIV